MPSKHKVLSTEVRYLGHAFGCKMVDTHFFVRCIASCLNGLLQKWIHIVSLYTAELQKVLIRFLLKLVNRKLASGLEEVTLLPTGLDNCHNLDPDYLLL